MSLTPFIQILVRRSRRTALRASGSPALLAQFGPGTGRAWPASWLAAILARAPPGCRPGYRPADGRRPTRGYSPARDRGPSQRLNSCRSTSFIGWLSCCSPAWPGAGARGRRRAAAGAGGRLRPCGRLAAPGSAPVAARRFGRGRRSAPAASDCRWSRRAGRRAGRCPAAGAAGLRRIAGRACRRPALRRRRAARPSTPSPAPSAPNRPLPISRSLA